MSWFGGITTTDPWEESDSEEEYEEGLNETAIEEIDPAFINHVMKIKQMFYDLTVNAQPLETPGAQTMDSLDDYKKRLVEVHTFLKSVRTQDKMHRNEKIKQFTQFPEGIRQQNADKIMELREELRELIDNWILTQYNHAKTEDLPQYDYFMKQKLTVCPHEFNKGWCKNPNEEDVSDEMEIQ